MIDYLITHMTAMFILSSVIMTVYMFRDVISLFTFHLFPVNDNFVYILDHFHYDERKIVRDADKYIKHIMSPVERHFVFVLYVRPQLVLHLK